MYFMMSWKALRDADEVLVEGIIKTIFDGQPFINVYDAFEIPNDVNTLSGGVVLFNLDGRSSPASVDQLGRSLNREAKNRFSYILVRCERGVSPVYSLDLNPTLIRQVVNH
jgi:hypothetical protein